MEKAKFGRWINGGNPLEKDIEKYLRKAIRNLGGECLKFVSPGTNGVPDRIVMVPNGWIFFIELKRKGAKPRPLQRMVHGLFMHQGHKVYVIDSLEGVDQFLYHLFHLVDADRMKRDNYEYYDKFHQNKRLTEFLRVLGEYKKENELDF